MVQQLINGIQVQNNLNITLTKTKVKDEKIGNWLVDLYYVATKVTEDFGVTNNNKRQGCRGNSRMISLG